ncbi:glycosyltransferase family 4 protein [Xylaria bambusicola]|uniref:glycosyltransferase family 4 protein n=1 Tax=Xylaria bambusicola TaxID=326684 RepID=UPI002008A6D0|nr:glycosyltransferase family 4 protein [Xylaria bambusicola]KAI0505304.1 glycosyltransferase family 4 protein [Xylaria bambusicola]
MDPLTLLVTGAAIAVTPFAAIALWHLVPVIFRAFIGTIGSCAGWYLRKKTDGRRALIIRATEDGEASFREKNEANGAVGGGKADGEEGNTDREWTGIVGFFHPFCNAGGGGERVLWAAVRATQQRWPKAKIVVYTGDHDVSKDKMLSRVKNTFSIDIHPPTIHFLYLSTRHWVLATTWPHATLLGQSLGSVIMGWDAFSLVVPDIFVDTMGYAFTLGLSKLLFPKVPTAAYVHYPTISTDMLESLDPKSAVGNQGVNAGKGAGFKGALKRHYWKLFAALYSRMGASVDVVMTNSTWTQGHIQSLWGARRKDRSRQHEIAVVYPPCAVTDIEEAVELTEQAEKKREKCIVYIAQFRPEKNHKLILNSFAEFVQSGSAASKDAKLVLLGSVRDDSDSRRVYELRLLANELHIKDRVIFKLDVPWSEVLEWLGKAYIGANGMWNEHFGIGVVEYQAAGLISVVHNSGGPKLDIVADIDGEPTGFHATTTTEYAEGFEKAFSLPDPLAVRLRARKSSRRFSDEEFTKRWLAQLEKVVGAMP